MLSNLKIIFVLDTLELGGAERQASILARHLKASGCRVEVWSFTEEGAITEILDRHEIPWRYVQLSWSEGTSLQQVLDDFAGQLRRAQPDVLLPYTITPNLACALVWRSTGARLCVWNQRGVVRGRQIPEVERTAIAQVPLFISNSVHGAEFLVETVGVKQELVRVVLNGVETPAPQMDRTRARQHFNIPEDALVACMIANLRDVKDHITLLKAWRLVIDKLKAEKLAPLLLLAGRDHHMKLEPLQGLSKELELQTSVRFLGQVKNIPDLIEAIDLGVFSTYSEGCPNGVLECMAAEKAIAATDIPGVREAVAVEEYPYLATPLCPENLAKVTVELLTQPARRAELGRLNRKRIETEFSVSRLCHETTSLILDHMHA